MARDPDPPASVTGPQAELLRLTYGALAAQAVYVAAKLRLADLLKHGPRPATALAAAAGVDAAILTRFLRALVSLGVVVEMAGDRFALTAVGHYLRADRASGTRW